MLIRVQDRGFQRGICMGIARDALGCPREAQRPYRSAAKPLRIERGRLTLLGREGITSIGAGIQKRTWRGRGRALEIHMAPVAYDALPTRYHTPKALLHAAQVFLLDDQSSPSASLQFWCRYAVPTSLTLVQFAKQLHISLLQHALRVQCYLHDLQTGTPCTTSGCEVQRPTGA